ncbi:hypothetical protein [Nostoc sp. S13]|uniref:hypothetical protein n=1 Tax=Nostoc sp. S13 TaxID=3019266 RepID=UPI00261B6AB8|nr:hypothetical protein [Nostoc sp. S13]MDF5739242.1 hypothetical protein [Nostoc sp. S13]
MTPVRSGRPERAAGSFKPGNRPTQWLPVVATGTTRREVGAAASAVSVAVASPRASLNFSQGETLRERWKSEFERYFA